MRRLSIVDLEGGRQPMAGASGQTWVVFNGEIFNARELRNNWLQGVTFSSDHSDTEVLINLYEKFGPEVVQHLNGMFGFVICDTRRQVLFGARDPLGIKPLYYHCEGEYFSFSSEITSLRMLPWIDFEIDPNAVNYFLACQTIPSPQTIYRSIRKLGPGECFTYDLTTRKLKIERYWRPRFLDKPIMDRREARELVRTEFIDAVERWSRSDVPIACSLSGGLDSSAVVGALAAGGHSKIKTFSLGFNDAPDIDERDLASSVADRWQTEHQEIVVSGTDLLSELPHMVEALEEPYAGGLPSWWVFKSMAEHVKVGMTGSGGDELFSNYGKYDKFEQIGDRLRRSLGFLKRGGRLKTLVRHPFGALHYPYFPDGARNGLLSRDFRKQVTSSVEKYLSEEATASGTDSLRDRITYVDLRMQLPEEFLFMTDRFSMAHSLEARTPFLDRKFVESMLQIDPKVRIDRGKTLFKEAVGDLIPKPVQQGRKRGFVLPEAQWLREQLREQVETLLSESYLRDQGILNPNINKTLVRPHLAGTHNFGWQLWILLMFQLWYCHCFKKAS